PLSSDEVANLYNFAPGPVGYWQFEEHQGVTASDTSSYGNTGTLITNSGSPRWVAGKYGGAIKVKQGDSSYIDVADSASLSPTSVSISFWTKLDSLPTGGTASFLDKNNTYGVDVTTAGALIFQYNGGNSFTANTTLVTNKWYYITAVFDPTTGWQSIYINGVLDKTRISGSTGISDTATTLRIGGNQGTGRSISGIVDEVRVYNFPLTTKQIVSDMNASHPSVGSPIGSAIGWWQFDDGYGTVASDSGFLRKNGSLYRATWSDDSKFGKALFFDGNSYVQLGNVSEYKLETKSVSFWAKPGSAPAATQGIVAAGSVANWYVGVTANAGSKMILSYANSAGTQKTVNSTSNIDVVNWHHYAYTFSVDQNSNVTLKMYIDGKLDKTTTNTDGYSGTYGSNFLLGSFAVSSNFYKGLLDEVRIYNYELSASEVKLDMNQGKSLVLGAFGMDSSGVASNSANATYCVPGDTIQACAPTGEWTFEEGYGNVTNDMTGGGSNGVWRGTGTRWVQGKIGKAGYFNGADSSVNTNGQFSFTSGQSFTLAAWIKSSFLESSGANTYSILSKGCGFVGTYALWYRASTTNADAYFCIHPTTGGGSQISAVGTTKIHDNKWHYLVGVRDVTADNIYIYVDGKLEGTTADTTTGDFNRSATVLIGARGVDTLEKFTGSIDQAQIYNYALSPAQVAWNYNRGKPVAYYDLDECQGSTLHEFYNTGIDQTITIGGSGTTAIGTCTTSSSAWGGASGTAVGKYNYALTLDGTDDYASTSGTVMIAPSQSTYTTVSWGGWFNPVTGVASKTIIEKNREFRLTTDASSQPNCSIWNAGNWVTSAVAGTALPLSSWSHVMCVYDGTTLRVYVNGMSSGSVSQTNAITSLSYTPLSTARDFGGSAFYKGQVDDVQIFNYPLTAVQVRNLYNQSSAIRFGPLTGTP
ncbi:MAG: LamG domain-containing protein, partial [bacterium]|nr:LamG domain-containing protein [bacterium]